MHVSWCPSKNNRQQPCPCTTSKFWPAVSILHCGRWGISVDRLPVEGVCKLAGGLWKMHLESWPAALVSCQPPSTSKTWSKCSTLSWLVVLSLTFYWVRALIYIADIVNQEGPDDSRKMEARSCPTSSLPATNHQWSCKGQTDQGWTMLLFHVWYWCSSFSMGQDIGLIDSVQRRITCCVSIVIIQKKINQ